MRVIQGGAEVFDALIYHEPHPETMNFLQNQFDNMSNAFGSAGSAFMETARNTWERFGSSDALQRAKAAVRMVKHMWQRDEIRSIWEMGAFQQAPLSMQRFLMANPVVREKFNNQLIDGYSDTYVDMYPKAIGWAHYDYQLARHGFFQVTEPEKEGGDHGFHVEFFFDDPVQGDRRLTHIEQHDIDISWDAMNALLADGGEDPTSVYANKL